MQDSTQKYSKLWPLLIRLYHWSMVALLLVAYFSAEDYRFVQAHYIAGSLLFSLTLWRIYYGFYGPSVVRFKSFYCTPKTLIEHMKLVFKRKAPKHIGHPPPVAWISMTVMTLIVLLVLTGLITLMAKEQYQLGSMLIALPYGFQSFDIHDGLFTALLVVVSVHLLGVLNESVHKKMNLAKTMWDGKIKADKETIRKINQFNYSTYFSPVSFTIVFAFILLPVVAYAMLKPLTVDLGQNETVALWEEECGGCHMLYHPSLLPAESWVQLMNSLENHFDEDASIDEDDALIVTQFLKENAAEKIVFKAGYKISQSLNLDDVYSISHSRYWEKKHKDLNDFITQNDDVGNKSNCSACHADYETGRFDTVNISLPKGS